MQKGSIIPVTATTAAAADAQLLLWTSIAFQNHKEEVEKKKQNQLSLV